MNTDRHGHRGARGDGEASRCLIRPSASLRVTERELAAGKGFLFSDVGEVVPKGFEEPVRRYDMRWREEG